MATVGDETAQNLNKSEEVKDEQKQKEEEEEAEKQVPIKDETKDEKIEKIEKVVETEKQIEEEKEEQEEIVEEEEEEEECEEIIIEEEVETEDENDADEEKIEEVETKVDKPLNNMSESTTTTETEKVKEVIKEEIKEEVKKEEVVKEEPKEIVKEETPKVVESFVSLENVDETEENEKKIEETKTEEEKKDVKIEEEVKKENENLKKNEDEIDGLKILQQQQQKLIQANQQLTNLANKQHQQQPSFMNYDEQPKQQQVPIFYEQQQQQQQQQKEIQTKTQNVYDQQLQQQKQYQTPTFYEPPQQQQQLKTPNFYKQQQTPSFYEQQKPLKTPNFYEKQQTPSFYEQQQKQLKTPNFYEKQQQQQQRVGQQQFYQPDKQQEQQQSQYETIHKLQYQQQPSSFSTYSQEHKHRHEESTTQKQIDLQKIFTPAEDAEYILPKNRKLYASSAFYTPGLHPTVEDQVELARRISHSLSDISNQQSKGQSMYVNRKKRSVKWVHEGQGQDYQQNYQSGGGGVPYKAPASPNLLPAYSEAGKHRVQLNLQQEQLLQKYVKPELRVVKTPWEAALETGSASTAFVEAPQLSNSPYLQPQQQQRARSMTPMPRQTNQQNQQQLAQQPKPYQNPKQYQQPQPKPQFSETTYDSHFKLPKANQQPLKYCSNYQRDLAYKPSVPQGWKSNTVNLPTELYVPREIPLESYAPPPPMPTALTTSAPATTIPWSPTPTPTTTSPWSPSKSVSVPKQQYLPPNNYQQFKTLPNSPPMSGVNYTPAPLSQQKLEPWSKFPTSETPSRHYAGPSFNNAARGWHKSANSQGFKNQSYAPPTRTRATSEHRPWHMPEQLPYTDF